MSYSSGGAVELHSRYSDSKRIVMMFPGMPAGEVVPRDRRAVQNAGENDGPRKNEKSQRWNATSGRVQEEERFGHERAQEGTKKMAWVGGLELVGCMGPRRALVLGLDHEMDSQSSWPGAEH
jgi:hypothetical protein